MCRALSGLNYRQVECENLSKDKGGQTGDTGEEGRASKAASGTRGRDVRDGGVARGGGLAEGDNGDGGGSLSLAGDLNGRVLNRGEHGGVALGDGGGGVAGNADRGLLSRVGRQLRNVSSGGAVAAGVSPGRVLRDLGDLRNLGLLRDMGNVRGDRADGGGDGDGLGHDNGAVGRAVRDLRATVGDGVDLGGVDSRSRQGDGGGGDDGRLSRAVSDGRAAAGDGDQAGGVRGRDGGLGGHGANGEERSSDGETHLEGCLVVRENGEAL